MKMEDNNKNKLITEIFKTMEYGNVLENYNSALEWFKKKQHVFAYVDKVDEHPNGTCMEIKHYYNEQVLCMVYTPEIDTIKTILTKSLSKTRWFDTNVHDRVKLIYKFAELLEKNASKIAEIELCARGISIKDSKSTVRTLVDYLKYNSNLGVKHTKDNISWKPQGLAVGVISNESPLTTVAMVLAPALAAGYNIILQAGSKISLVISYLFELANNIGISEDILRLIPSDGGELVPYLNCENVAIVSIFDDLKREKYRGFNSLKKKIINFSSSRIPLIVFDDADLDSVIEALVDAAWGHQGMGLWNVNVILVQENIINKFVERLKTKISSIKIGASDNKMIDIATPNNETLKTYFKTVERAEAQGLEVFQAVNNSFSPTMIIGGKVGINNVIKEDENAINIPSVLAFRTIDEAVALANNTRQGLAASVWTENISLVNEMTRKLKVSTIWINSYGLTSVDIPISSYKNDGVGYVGGKEGYQEYIQVRKAKSESASNAQSSQNLDSKTTNVINTAQKAQIGWNKVSKLKKMDTFQQVINYIDSQKKQNAISEQLLNNLRSTIYECMSESNGCNYSATNESYSVNVFKEPKGVIMIEMDKDINACNFKLLFAALFAGNSVIITNCNKENTDFYSGLSKLLPSGILTVLPFTADTVRTAAMHKGLDAYYGEDNFSIFACLPLKESKIYGYVNDDWEELFQKVTLTKSVWSSIGMSSQCNL